MIYAFGEYQLDLPRYELRHHDEVCRLEPQEFSILVHLIEQRERVVTKEELLEQVWPDQFVSEATLSQRIMTVRKALGESGRAQHCIKTIHGRGYRFVADVVVTTSDSVSKTPVPTQQMDSLAEEQTPSETVTRPSVEATVSAPASAEPTLGAERRQLTILFCDLVGSTALSEQLDPEDLDDILQAYYATCAESIESFDGHVAQYLGDGLLVYFGYPHAQEDAARRAVHASLDLLQAMSALNQQLDTTYHIQLAVRIGIHTGLVVIGEGRVGGRAEQLAVGATPNLASRIQALSAPNTVSVSEATHSLIQGYFEQEELGQHELPGALEPMSLYRIIGAHERQHRLDAQPAERLTPFVGRDMECFMLQECWEEVKSGQGRVALLSGEAGIGKSRLVRTVLAKVSEEPHLLLEGHCSPYHQQTAFYPIVNLLRTYLQWDTPALESSPLPPIDQLDQLARNSGLDPDQSVPLLAALLGLPLPPGRYPDPALSPRQHRQHTLDTLLNIVTGLSAQQPVLLFLEDIHWLDPSTFDWLDLLVSQGPTASILTLLTSRPDFQSPWSGRSHVKPLTLNRLTQAQIAQIVQSIAGTQHVSADVMDQLTSTTDGVPLFVEEVTKWMIGPTSPHMSNATQADLTVTTDIQIPTTLQDLLTARLDSVGEAKRTAQLGATVGREFAYELLRALSPLEEDLLQMDLAALVAADLLYQRGSGHQATYRFKHALIQDAAYQSVLRRTRQELHAQVGQLLELQFSDIVKTQPELVAYHYTEAGNIELAIQYWQHAGRYANSRSAHIEAMSHFRNGLHLLQSLPSSKERDRTELSLLSALGPVVMALKGYRDAEVEQTYQRARQLCQQLNDPRQIFPVLYGLYELYEYRGIFQTSQQVGEELLSVALREGEPTLLLGAHEALACTGFHLGAFDQVLRHTTESFNLYDRQQHTELVPLYGRDVAVSSHYWAAMSLWFQGYKEQAWAQNTAALDLAQELAHPYSISMTFIRAAFLGQFCQLPTVTHQWAAAAMTLATEHGFLIHAAIATIMQGWTLAIQRQGSEGSTQLRQGLHAYQESGGEMDRPYFLALLAEAYYLEGQFQNGLDALEEALQTISRGRDFFYEAELYRLQGMLQQACFPDQEIEAETQYRQALDVARNQQAKSLELRAAIALCQLWRSQGNRKEAVELLTPIYNWFTEGFDSPDLQNARQLLDELKA